MKIKYFLISVIASFALMLFANSASAAPLNSSPITSILQSLQTKGYKNFKEVEQEHGIYKIDARDTNNQECEIKLNAQDGSFAAANLIHPKKSMLETVKMLEEQGYKINNIELESMNMSYYYKVKALNPQGSYHKFYVNADTGAITSN